MEVEKRMVTIGDVLGADEVLLTNSSWGVLPVVAVESRRIGAGEPGAIGREAAEAWNERMAG
jgi:branched-chain amino acid aminotransferase